MFFNIKYCARQIFFVTLHPRFNIFNITRTFFARSQPTKEHLTTEQQEGFMVIDFPNMPVEVIQAFKGGEREISLQTFTDEHHKIMHGILVPGASIGLHKHETNDEVLFVLSGHGTILEDGKATPLLHGQCTYCPKGHEHSLINTSEETDLEFFAVVSEL